MSKISDELKNEIAEELGIDEIVKEKGFGEVSSKDCGNIVKKAIEKANKVYKSHDGK